MESLKGKTFAVLGSHGFIGSALVASIRARGGEVVNTPTVDCSAVLHFASYTHLPFEKNVAYHTNELLSSLLYLFPFCKEHDIPLIYPSSALIYEKPRPFYHFKKMIEEMQYIYNAKSCALRIFPVYGAGEGERGHTTAIYQWCRDMMRGKKPILFGDGEQKRAFTYIDDVVNFILSDEVLGVKEPTVKDVGSPEMLTFYQIVGIINDQLGTNITPTYLKAPEGYAEGVVCPNPLRKYHTLEYGIESIIEELKQ